MASLTEKEKYRPYTEDMDLSRGRRRNKEETLNVGIDERWVSAIGGGALAAYGLKQRNWFGAALAVLGGVLVYRGAAGRCPMYQALGINTNADTNRLGRRKVHTDRAIKIEKSVIIDRPHAELYRFWRNFENLPRFMNHLESVRVKDDHYSHWIVKAPLGMKVEWDAEVINEVPDERIGWRSVGTGDVDNAGSVSFHAVPGGRATEVRVMLQYDPPAGLVGAAMAKIFGESPDQQVEEDLHRFKQLMESAGIPPAAQASGHQAG